MILQDWLKELDYTLIQGNPDTQVEEVIYDSRKAGPGTVFVAMTGTRIDAHCFIPDVLKAGIAGCMMQIQCSIYSIRRPLTI